MTNTGDKAGCDAANNTVPAKPLPMPRSPVSPPQPIAAPPPLVPRKPVISAGKNAFTERRVVPEPVPLPNITRGEIPGKPINGRGSDSVISESKGVSRVGKVMDQLPIGPQLISSSIGSR